MHDFYASTKDIGAFILLQILNAYVTKLATN